MTSGRHTRPRSATDAILGIDAAWTKENPSGVALLVREHGSWRCAGVAPSYRSFIDLGDKKPVDWHDRPKGGEADFAALLDAAVRLAGGERPCIVAVDMPVATTGRITERRKADRKTSQCFGEFGCPVHSPTKARPGKVGKRLMKALEEAGYPLATTATDARMRPATIEVYPHAAIVRLMRLKERYKYKVSKSRRLWPKVQDVQDRVRILIGAFRNLRRALDGKIADINLPLPESSEGVALAHLKPYEDVLDALVCAWAGICYLEGRAEPLGDETAAIWVPAKDLRLAPQPS